MYPLVPEYLRCDMTQQAFCDKKRISYGMFMYWLNKYNDSQRPKPQARAASFTGVKITPAQQDHIIIKYASGTEVHIPV